MRNSNPRQIGFFDQPPWFGVAAILVTMVFVPLVTAEGTSEASRPGSDPTIGNHDQPNLKQRSKDLLAAKTVVFLGDSITHGGAFIGNFEAILLQNFDSVPNIINLG